MMKISLKRFSNDVKIHGDKLSPSSSAAACINVLGYLNRNSGELIPFFEEFGLKLDKVVDFPTGANVGGRIYPDKGHILFEWIGPRVSPINEKGGSRGLCRTSIDGFFITKQQGKYVQVFVEWKFAEKYNAAPKFSRLVGVERLRRYSLALLELKKDFPFDLSNNSTIGLADFSYEPLNQLLRMTLLAKKTTPISIGGIQLNPHI
ncbi:MAG: hypothetical protein LBP51_04315 [Deferribacteraceae bacterium]|jgi:hypothetical protein|nr:hypothetical protein [Deferribacteraceae bacterium]